MLLRPIDFIKKIKETPIYLLFGEEDFLIDDTLNQIREHINQLIKKENLEFLIIDTDKIKLTQFLDMALSYPMMSEKKIIIIRHFEDFFSSKSKKLNEESKKFEDYLRNPPEYTNLILTAQLDKVKDLAKVEPNGDIKDNSNSKIKDLKFPFDLIIKDHNWMEFTKVYENNYPKWIENRFKFFNKKINLANAQLLSIQVKNSLRDINSEIEKIVIYLDDRVEVNENDIFELSGTTKEYNFFELQKNIANRDLSKSVLIVNKMLENESQEMLIISLLLRFFINSFKLIDIKQIISDENLIAKEMGMLKWQLYDYNSCIRNYSAQEIEDAILNITESDFSLKSNISDKLAIIQNLIINIVKN